MPFLAALPNTEACSWTPLGTASYPSQTGKELNNLRGAAKPLGNFREHLSIRDMDTRSAPIGFPGDLLPVYLTMRSKILLRVADSIASHVSTVTATHISYRKAPAKARDWWLSKSISVAASNGLPLLAIPSKIWRCFRQRNSPTRPAIAQRRYADLSRTAGAGS